MSLTFTKLFSSITESTVWMTDESTRIVWITMLAMADKKGRVWASMPGLANRARVSAEACQKAIHCFLSPDPESRTKDHEGRRIEPIDGGWRLLNYQKYREIRDIEDQREKDAVRKQKSRMSKKSHQVTPCLDNAEAEAEIKEEGLGKLFYENEIPQHINTAEFRALWKDWVSLRRAGKKSRNPDTMFRQQLRDMGEWGLAASLEALKTAIRGDYNGIFPPKNLKAKTQIHLRPAPTP